MKLLKQLWDFDFLNWHSSVNIGRLVFMMLVISGLVFILGQIVLGGNPLSNGFTLPDLIDVVKKDVMVTDVPDALSIVYPYIWLGLASFYFISALLVYVLGYFASRKMIGDQMFNRYFITYNLSFIVGSALVLGISGILKAMGLQVNIAVEYVAESTNIIKSAIGSYIPTIFQVKSYWVAVLASISFASLPSYVAHRLCHESRFFWNICHRGHHAPKFLHPMAAPPAYVLDFFLIIPTGIVGLMISKLIYAEPLVMEMALWFTGSLALGPLSHCSALYDKA
jgi:sterol desaturase/sphingolipid hydroxylase (fatty acid hydroxylase superfamily)